MRKIRSWKQFLPLVLLACPFLAPVLASEASASEASTSETENVVERCVEALGGEAAWQAIHSLDVTCRHDSFGQTMPCRLRRQRPNLYRLDYSESSTPRTDAFDGNQAWWQTTIPLISRATWPVPVPAIYQDFIRRQAEFEWSMIGAEQKGHSVRSLGETSFEGETFLGLHVVLADGHEETWYLDPETYLPTLKVDEGVYHGYHVEIRTHFSDYREVSGVRLPFVNEYEQGNDYRIVEIQEVSVNSAVNAATDINVFQRPLPPGMTALQPLVGEWNVTLESRDDPAFHTERERDWEEHQSRSIISSRHDGALLTEELAVTTKRPRRIERSFSYDRFRGVYRVVIFDTFSQQLDVLESSSHALDNAIVLTNLETGTTTEIHDQGLHVRETLANVTADSFRIERELSRDGGKTWWTELRLHYERSPGSD